MTHPQDQLFRDWLSRTAETLHVPIEPMQLARLCEHWRLVIQANQDFNLTRLTDPAEAAVNLVGDSLAVLPWAAKRLGIGWPARPATGGFPGGTSPQSWRVLDMGTGAGYPALPLAICRPDWGVVAIDSSAKKIRFVARAAAALQLPNVLTEHVHAREWHGKIQPFDLIVTRALGNLASVVREGARLLAPTGYLVSYHAPDQSPGEAKAAGQMLKRYKLREVDWFDYTLPGPGESFTRRLIIIGRTPLDER